MNMTRKVSVAIAIGLILLALAPANAVELRGSIFSDWYAFRLLDTTHVRSYLGARGTLVAWRGRHDQTLEFHTSFRWAGDLSHSQGLAPQVFVYETYARLSNLPRGLELSLGRQFTFNGLQSLLLDGLRARYSPMRRLQVELFGGATALSSDPEKIQSLSHDGVAGGRISYAITESFRTGVSALSRKSEGFGAVSQYGLDLEKEIGRWDFFTKGAYNSTQSRLADFLARLSVRPRNWYFAGEFSYRQPSVSDASIWSIIDFADYRQARFEARRVICKSLSIGGQLYYSASDPTNTVRTTFGISSGFYSIGWSHQNGSGGDNNGFYGTLNSRLTPQLEAYVSSNLTQYRVDVEQPDWTNSYGTTLGLLWHNGSGYSVRAEGQWFKIDQKANTFVLANTTSQVRFYLRASKDFSLGRAPQRVKA